MINEIQFKLNGAANTDAGPSPSIWADCPHMEFLQDPSKGYHRYEDFLDYGPITAVTTDASLVGLPYNGFNSSGGTHTSLAADGGGLVITEATDNEASYVRTSRPPFRISAGLGDFWFEARVKVSAITDNQIGFILGMWDDVAASVVVPLSTANPPIMATTGNFFGFWGREEDAGLVGTTWKSDGNAGAGGLVVQSGVHQFVADTYVKLGMMFKAKWGNRLYFSVNGVLQTSYVEVPDNTGTGFPADVRVGFLAGHRLGGSSSSLTTVNWWRGAQKYIV